MIILVIAMIVAFIAVGVGMVLIMGKNSKQQTGRLGSRGIAKRDRYLKLARALSEFPLTRNKYNRIKNQVANLAVYDFFETQVQAVKFYLLSKGAMFGVTFLGAVIFRDVFSATLTFAFAVIIEGTLVGKQLDKVHFKVLQQLKISLGSMRECYMRSGYVIDAVQDCDKGNYVQRPLEQIHSVLTSNDSERKLDEFLDEVPFRKVQTLASVCWFINDSGDTVDDRGNRNFVSALGMIGSEIEIDLLDIVKTKNMFGVLEILPVAPMFAIPMMTGYFSSIIPGTSIFYNGLIGYISKIVIVLLGIIGYTVITNITRANSLAEDDRKLFIQALLKKDMFRQLVDDIRPKKARRRDALQRKLQGALSQKTPRDIYAEKLVYSSAIFIFTLISIFVILGLSREFIYNNVGSLSMMSSEVLTQEDIEVRIEIDEEYLALPELPTLGWTEAYIMGKFPDMIRLDRDEQVHRVMTKYESYHNAVFKWWMLLICYVTTFVGWKIPEIFLKARSTMLNIETEEDVMQVQTIIAILMNSEADTLEVLYWMARQSRIHKNSLVQCYHDYVSDPETALEILKDRTSSAEFKAIIDKLMSTVKDLSLAEAFSDLQAQRDFVLRMREITKDSIRLRKRGICKPLALAPIGALAILLMLLPIGILGFQEFQKAMSQMQG